MRIFIRLKLCKHLLLSVCFSFVNFFLFFLFFFFLGGGGWGWRGRRGVVGALIDCKRKSLFSDLSIKNLT